MPHGFGLVYKAVKLVLRFAGLYYLRNKSQYSAPQQAVIDGLITAAEALVAAVDLTLQP
jgi:hypothetical protein